MNDKESDEVAKLAMRVAELLDEYDVGDFRQAWRIVCDERGIDAEPLDDKETEF